MNICFYISDYGYGHASRSIAIIRKFILNFDNMDDRFKSDGTKEIINSIEEAVS
jgi:hypothetical protein